jgi:uncharacterized membrane protein YhiD involved in acid resistance
MSFQPKRSCAIAEMRYLWLPKPMSNTLIDSTDRSDSSAESPAMSDAAHTAVVSASAGHASAAMGRTCVCVALFLFVATPKVFPQDAVRSQPPAPSASTPIEDDLSTTVAQLRTIAIRLPVAALLGAALAFRPRRRGTPPRSAPVIQTQIILAIVGALVMVVVGASLARAFGVAGVAGLIRYRAKIEDPKDASVMLATLSVGLASGVGLFVMAIFGALFMLAVLWAIESIEPNPFKVFALKITSKESEKLQPRIEQLLRRHRATFELRAASPEEICYEVQLPIQTHTDALSNAIVRLDEASAVEWEEKKKKDKA